jgi:small multidrug resistance pump
MAIFLLFAAGTLSAIASVLLRVAATMNTVLISGGLVSLGTLTSGPMLMRAGAIGAYGAGFVLYAIALRRVELSVAYPLMVGITMLWPVRRRSGDNQGCGRRGATRGPNLSDLFVTQRSACF